MKITRRVLDNSTFDITDLSYYEFAKISSNYLAAEYWIPNRSLPEEGEDPIYDKFEKMKKLNRSGEDSV